MRRLYPTSQDIQEKNQRSRARGQRRGGGGGAVGIAEDGESQPARQRRYDEEKALPMPALTPVQPKRARISPTGGLKVHWARFKVRAILVLRLTDLLMVGLCRRGLGRGVRLVNRYLMLGMGRRMQVDRINPIASIDRTGMARRDKTIWTKWMKSSSTIC